MKKILSIISATIMLFCSISILAGCNSKDSSNSNSKAEVVLDKVSAAAAEKSIQPQAISIFNLSVNSTDSSNSESTEETPDTSVDIPADYTFIFTSQLEINFDIKLNNPQNYYIMDFKLTCDEEQIEYYDKEMEKWTPINNIWIRWSGSNNQESRYRLKLPNPEISPDKIKISEMYYSDRTDGTNKTAVNMNNKETYTIYKIESSLEIIKMTDIINSENEFSFKIDKIEGAEITGVVFDRNKITPDENGVYKLTKNGKLEIKYTYKVAENVIYKTTYEEDIKLMEIRFPEEGQQSIIILDDTTVELYVQLIGSHLDNDYYYIEEAMKDYKGTRYYMQANILKILTADTNDFINYANETEIEVGGCIYKISAFIKDNYKIEDYRDYRDDRY